MPIPDGPTVGSEENRYALWRKSLEGVLDLLGPTETRLRLGEDVDDLRLSIEDYFAPTTA